jgi:hypothetical protein
MSHLMYEEIEIGLDWLLYKLEALGGLADVEDLLRRARRRLIQASAVARPSVAVVGASTERSKYGNKAVRAFRSSGFDVYPIHPRAKHVEGLNERQKLITLRLPAETVNVPYGPLTRFEAIDGSFPEIVPGMLINVNRNRVTVLARGQYGTTVPPPPSPAFGTQ